MPNRIKDKKRFAEISALVDDFSDSILPLIGIDTQETRTVFLLQLIDSIRRIEFLQFTSMRAKSAKLYEPYSGSFDPFGGAAVLNKIGDIDNAYWLIFLATHFSKHKEDGWNLTEDFYGKFGEDGIWDWATVSLDPNAVHEWLEEIYPHKTSEGRSRRFGNHRKFETLKPTNKGTGYVVKTYVEWILKYGSHQNLIRTVQQNVGQNPQDAYAFLYKELDEVAKMGRLGKFDFLCNLSNLQIAPIFPDKAYIVGSTGPFEGAKLLFGDLMNSHELDRACANLASHLKVSPQVIEDALCNWQKSREAYHYFRG
jgi:hypothetical protein